MIFNRLRSDPEFAKQVSKRLNNKLNPDFHSEMESVYELINKNEASLTKSYEQHVLSSAKMDEQQMDLVIKLCTLLGKFYSTKMGALKAGVVLDEEELAAYEAISLFHCRHLLLTLFMQFIRLSGEIRGRYKSYLLPESMRWESFQRLAWIINSKPEGLEFECKFSIPKGADHNPIRHFADEVLATEEIMEPAVYGIIEHDIPSLKKLALIIKLDVTKKLPDNYVMQTVELRAMSTLVKRMGDILSLEELLELTCNIGNDAKGQVIGPQGTGKPKEVKVSQYEQPVRYSHKTIFEKYATLQRIYRIGELLTGKHLSLNLSQLDPTTDWNALIDIRDAIAHPEERGNHAVLEKFLADDKLLDDIVNDELPAISVKITQIIYKRDQVLPGYDSNHEKFWQTIYEHERKPQHMAVVNPSKAIKKLTDVSDEDKAFLIKALKDDKKSDGIVQKWQAILECKETLPTSRNELGKILQADLPHKGDKDSVERARYNRLKSIIDTIHRPRTTIDLREQQRKQEEEDAKQLKMNREAAFVGLNKLRLLAQQFNSLATIKMNKNSIINACIKAIENITDLTKTIVSPQLVDVMQKKGRKALTEQQRLDLLVVLRENFKKDKVFRRALEYNAIQCFQYMDIIKAYPEINAYPKLTDAYELTREFRNYLAHGNLAVEVEHHPAGIAEIISPRNYLVPLLSLSYCFEFLPHLQAMRDKLLLKGKWYSLFVEHPKVSIAAAMAVVGVGVTTVYNYRKSIADT